MKKAKRAADIIVASIGLLLFSPLLMIAAAAILVCDGKPVFYRQKRIGYMGSTFSIRKLRTMVNKAELYGGQITIGNDPRVTRTGRILRRLKVDELPQLINVLLGEMSLVGPRPEVPKYVALYTPEQRKVLNIMPGITDPASIKYRNENEILAQTIDPEESYVNKIMPEKININTQYAAEATMWTDLLIIVRTIWLLIKDSNPKNNDAQVIKKDSVLIGKQ